jgi:hypothetical protein
MKENANPFAEGGKQANRYLFFEKAESKPATFFVFELWCATGTVTHGSTHSPVGSNWVVIMSLPVTKRISRKTIALLLHFTLQPPRTRLNE